MVLLAICVVLRFCDPWLFGAEVGKAVRVGNLSRKGIWRVQKGEVSTATSGKAPTDSVSESRHFFR